MKPRAESSLFRRLDERRTGRRIPIVKVKEAIKMIEEDGWVLVRTRGSHRHFHHPTKPGTVTVAGKPSVDIPRGTLTSILRQAGLKKSEGE